ncbi:MAG TPA: flagellar motor switch protein FliG [Candidatus Binatia bacterium]|nr:flagellar motor switch protein FliG [Candidatus Binatia bacterium]
MSSSVAAVPKLNGIRKAAVLLVLLGEEAAAGVYRNLSPTQLQRLTREIRELDGVQPELAAEVLEDFHRLSLSREYLAEGGEGYARSLLMKAFGSDGAQAVLDEAGRAQLLTPSQMEVLQRANPRELARFVEGEQPQTIAIILAYLDVKASSALLTRLPEAVRVEAVKRLALLRNFSPEMAQKVSLVLHRKLQSLGEQSRRLFPGVKSAADLMNRLEPEVMKSVLDSIEAENATLALNIRNLMFTYDDLLTVPAGGIRELVARLDKKVLTLALKGSSEEMRNHLIKAISARAWEMLKEDMEVMGPVRSREVNRAKEEVVAVARQLEAEGKIILKPEAEDEFIV